jgi:hypothetical protein
MARRRCSDDAVIAVLCGRERRAFLRIVARSTTAAGVHPKLVCAHHVNKNESRLL